MRQGQLTQAKQVLDTLPKNAIVLAAFGKYYLAKRDLSKAIESFERSQQFSSNSTTYLVDFGYALWLKHLENQKLKVSLDGIAFPEDLQSLDRGEKQKAIDLWQQVLAGQSSLIERSRASIYLATADLQYFPLAENAVVALPDNSDKVPYLLNLYNLSLDVKWLKLALPLAGDSRTQSWINYKLGRWDTAIELASSIPAPDLIWRYQWDLAKNLPSGAKQQKYLELAVANAEFLKGRVQLPFEETNLLYRDAAANLLSRGQVSKAIKVLQLFNLNQLESFFQDNCFTRVTGTSGRQESQTAIIRTLVTPNVIYIIVTRSGKDNVIEIPIAESELLAIVKDLRLGLQDVATNRYLEPASKLHRLLIEPISSTLKGVSKLKIVGDSRLSIVPYAALFDARKQRYLIEDFAISYSPGLETGATAPQSSTGKESLFVAIANPPQPWRSLPYAAQEVKSIAKKLNFTPKIDLSFAAFTQQLQSKKFDTVHLASHARIAVNIEQSQVLFRDRSVQFGDFVNNLPPSISLLVLSGCQTGIGDSQSVFGLAGLTLKSGIERVVASLWSVNDAGTEDLMQEFYLQRKAIADDAKALQLAQVKSLRSPNFHPYAWSSFILVEK